MNSEDIESVLSLVFAELVDGTSGQKGAFVLNTGDVGLLRSLHKLSAADASRSVNSGATIAAHAQHVRYGLSLMNRWAAEGGDPFADATWDEAWKTSAVDERSWQDIQTGLEEEAHRWLETLRRPRAVSVIELTGMTASVAHLAYHLGAIRKSTRIPAARRKGPSRLSRRFAREPSPLPHTVHDFARQPVPKLTRSHD